VAWLQELPRPGRAWYEAGPDWVRLYRAAVAAEIEMQVVAPGKAPRGSADRVKTGRKDADLLTRCLLAWSLHPDLGPAGRDRRAVVAHGRAPARGPDVDTPTALSIHLELGGNCHTFHKAHRVGFWLG
jgi:hypothetical protein